jgi:hypothetical protein
MDLTFSEPEIAFRDELRAWFAANDPGAEPPHHEERLHFAWRRDFQRRLFDGGWAAPHWPVEYGGRGATLTQSAIFFEELGRARAPLPANVLGLLLGGPTLMVWGTEAQRDRHLGPILSAEEIWCQGFSEPDAGSDRAEDARRQGRQRLARHGPEGVDQRRALREVVHARRPHGRRSRQAQGADVLPDGHGPIRGSGAAAAADDGRVGVQRAVPRWRMDRG